jgi:hypothetical protein
MSSYLYAIGHANISAPARGGLGGEALRSVAAGGLGAVVSDHPDVPPSATEELLWSHERIVEQLSSYHDVLPARFGSLLTNDGAVRSLLRDRQADLAAALRRVAGADELALRAGWVADHPTDARVLQERAAGAAYLAHQLELRGRARELAERLNSALRGLARDSRVRLPASPSAPLRAAYLVARDRAEQFRRRVDELDRELEDVEIACTGPWPPYSFVERRRVA